MRAVPLSLVHCCGLDVSDPAQVQFLVDRNISIVWSPVSNLLLYGDTLDVERLRQAGINVALGSDWSPSGSKHVGRGEVRAAVSGGDRLDDERCGCVSHGHRQRQPVPRQRGAPGGSRKAPARICSSSKARSSSDNALEVFFTAEDRDVLATIVNGVPIYGRRAFLDQFDLPLQALPAREGSAARDRRCVCRPAEHRRGGCDRRDRGSPQVDGSAGPAEQPARQLRQAGLSGVCSVCAATSSRSMERAADREAAGQGDAADERPRADAAGAVRVWCGFKRMVWAAALTLAGAPARWAAR